MNLLAELREGMPVALDAIRANKLRATLTTLGIVIGIVTVTLMGTAIDGLNKAFLHSVSILGTDVLYIDRFSWFNRTRADWMKARNYPDITLAQIRELEKQLTLAQAVAPFTETRTSVRYGNRRSSSVMIVGTTEQFRFTGGMLVEEGRFFSGDEARGGRPVCVIGSAVATNLFLHESPLGKDIRLGHLRAQVVGILAPQGSFLGRFSLDNQVIIPVKQFIGNFWNNPSFTIQVKASDPLRLDDTKEELRGVLRKLRRVPPGADDNFSINQQETLIQAFHRVAGTIAGVGLFITGLSLFVGAIGIMNVMFVSVAERTHEIGVRMAVGARRRTILVQFLIEAAGICLLGGLIAIAIAWPITLAMQRFFPATLSLPTVAIALIVSLLTGLAAGFLPAWRASHLDPVEALRNE